MPLVKMAPAGESLPATIPEHGADREREAFDLDETGQLAKRVVSTMEGSTLSALEEAVEELRAIRYGLELLLGGELRK